MKSGIYYTKCSGNGKIYVGQSMNIERRWSGHLYELRHGKHVNVMLQRSFNKYGEDSFEWNIITRVPSMALDQMEMDWIKFFDCMAPKGFNLMGGGGSLHSHSAISRHKMSKNRKGIKLSPEHCRKLSKAQKNRPPMTEETKRKMSESQKKRWLGDGAEEARRKIREKSTGRKHSPETLLKMSRLTEKRVEKRKIALALFKKQKQPKQPISPSLKALTKKWNNIIDFPKQ